MVELKIPQVGESIATVLISRWLKKPGDAVAAGEPVLEIDSDKASMEVPSSVAGVLVEAIGEEGDEVPILSVVARIDETAEVPAAAEATPAPETATPGAAPAGPAARAAAREADVDLTEVKGSGPKGRITRADVEKAAEQTTAVAQGGVAAPAPTQGTLPIERVRMTPLRRTIARRLVEAQNTAAMLTTFNEIDMGAVMDTRKRYQDQFVKRYGIKLGFMSFFVKATIEALKEYPAVNSEIDGDDVLYKRFYNIGVAVSGPKGLVVPVLKDADRLGFAETELAIKELAVRARDNKLRIGDFQDGTFTISNGGVFGSLMSTPILNPPQVGILGMHAINQRPMAYEGGIALRPMMYVALSYDHRIIDGREAVGFLKRIKECIEAPDRILLGV
ncbi:MAG: 2-oxoglutarate dehydrogenase complex dihydrolipoyllysine-residue succinyltransferase [Proteobacteria bacterium]|nr:2-oxoglutarate dehydrogenase complex dihydrolipoyllysine-residue succinyltransferase [Pseudomonadota bacterium]MCP4920049.1 2-oxoglutarate dehydrogenase complex dihydrolipoyllysine-residue succinyltransferase [Pseudomonadota bacterium]